MIREAKKDDISDIDYLGYLFNLEIQNNSPLNKLQKTKYTKPKIISSSQYSEYLSNKSKMFVAIENRKIIGFISGKILSQKNKIIEKYGKIDDLYVNKKYRGSGFASKLVKCLLKWFKKNKCKSVVLFASPDKPIQKYYSQIGFETIYFFMCKKL